MATSSVKVTPTESINPDPSTANAHHVGKPPTAFKNPWPSAGGKSGPWQAFQLKFGHHPEKNFVEVPQGPNGERSKELVKVQKPDWGVAERDKLRATWIGHASFLVETPATGDAKRGVRIFFDPVFSERVSPVTFLGPKRFSPTPCTLDEVPDVDIICISHNHYDHLDFNAVNELYKRRKGKIHFFAPLNNKSWFLQHIHCEPHEVTELDWWESCEVAVQDIGTVKLTCCPTQHFSARSPFDAGHTLWGSYAVEAANRKLFFSGDTAYQAHDTPSPCPSFKQIGETLGPFDLALLPIGCFKPQTFMANVHCSPEQSFEIHKDVRSKLSIGMHYGTVRGGLSASFEDVREPHRRWREAAEKENLWCGGGIEGEGSPVDTSKTGVGLVNLGETVAV